MEIKGAAALVTGANRGLGLAISRALVDSGAKVYGGARDPSAIKDPEITAVELDVTNDEQVTAAAATLRDVSIVVNNAGIGSVQKPLQASLDDARREMEVNYIGSLRVAQAFAPVLRENGGGALVNILSVASWVASPLIPTYSASKSAAWAISNALRMQLRAQRTLVMGVHLDFAETDLTAGLPVEKIRPSFVADAVVTGLADDKQEVIVDDYTRSVKAALPDDLTALYPEIERRFG